MLARRSKYSDIVAILNDIDTILLEYRDGIVATSKGD
jgi:hypothetical protein